MNGKERALAAIRFVPADRIPLWQPWYEPAFVENWRKFKGVGAEAHPLQCYRYDTTILIGDESYFPSQRKLIRREGEYEIWNDGWGCIVRKKPGGYFAETIDRMLKEPGDLDRIEFEPVAAPIRFEGLAESAAQARESGRCAFTKIGGLYNRSHLLRAEERLLRDMALDESFCDALFDRVARHFEQMAIETLRRTQTWDTGLFVYDDSCSSKGPMFSPRMFERYFLPRYQAIIARCRKAGCEHFFFHSDGNLGPVLDLLIEAGFEGFNPLEPRCGPGLVALRRKYGKKLVAIGGLCNTQILPRNDRREIEAHIRPLLELAREGGVILGVASIPGEMPPEAWDYAMRLIEDFRL